MGDLADPYDPMRSNKAAILNNINQAEGNSLASNQPAANTSQNRLIGALADPYNNMVNNWNTTKNAYSSGHIGQGLFDTYALAKNPIGNWQGSQMAGAQTHQAPEFGDNLFGEKDSNGIRPFNQQGKQHAIANAIPIADNSEMVNKFTTGSGKVPGMQLAQLKHGLLGRAADSYLNTVTGNMLQIGQQAPIDQPNQQYS